MKSPKNKTIDFTLEQGKHFLERCVKVNSAVTIDKILDKTILGDTLCTLGFLPEKSVDLLIADPYYNLDKSFHGNKFSKLKGSEYAEYTESWIKKIIPLLKPTASVYVCCDWQSSMQIGIVLGKYFNVINRITWQREKGRGARRNWKNSLEDIWFAVVSDEYTFNVNDVMSRRKVLAPYKVEGKPKDWEETAEGNFRNTYPSNFWDDISIPYWSMPENTAHPTQNPKNCLQSSYLPAATKGTWFWIRF